MFYVLIYNKQQTMVIRYTYFFNEYYKLRNILFIKYCYTNNMIKKLPKEVIDKIAAGEIV